MRWNAIILAGGESTYFGYDNMQNDMWVGVLSSKSLESFGANSGHISWGIYNGDTGSLVTYGYVENTVINYFSGNGYGGPSGSPNTGTFSYDKVCFVIHNPSSSEVISVQYAFAPVR